MKSHKPNRTKKIGSVLVAKNFITTSELLGKGNQVIKELQTYSNSGTQQNPYHV